MHVCNCLHIFIQIFSKSNIWAVKSVYSDDSQDARDRNIQPEWYVMLTTETGYSDTVVSQHSAFYGNSIFLSFGFALVGSSVCFHSGRALQRGGTQQQQRDLSDSGEPYPWRKWVRRLHQVGFTNQGPCTRTCEKVVRKEFCHVSVELPICW